MLSEDRSKIFGVFILGGLSFYCMAMGVSGLDGSYRRRRLYGEEAYEAAIVWFIAGIVFIGILIWFIRWSSED